MRSFRPRGIPEPIPFLILFCACVASAQPACTAPAARQFADEGGDHAAQCAQISYSHYPPTSGTHFTPPYWAAPGVYRFVVNAGYWVHSMEHGAVVFLINCRLDAACQDDFDRMKRIADAFPADPACAAADRHGIVIAADTLITTRFAAAAWNWNLESDCLDSAAFAKFLADHYGHSPEAICGGGIRFDAPSGCNAPLALSPPRSRARAGGPARPAPASAWPGLPEGLRPDGKRFDSPGEAGKPVNSAKGSPSR